eukprot:Skav227036  [mRNA]  locus=scaffold72:165096:168941:+ [translate_table: standard]
MFCNQEFYQRRKFFEYKIKIDIQDNFSKGSYAILRKKEQSILHEVPCVREAQADLVRSRKSQPTVRIRSDVRFHLNHAATFGDTSVRIVAQHDNQITLETHDKGLPASGMLRQQSVACSPDEIFDEFDNFWSQYWLRDAYEEQFQDDTWQSLNDHIDNCQLPNIPIIDLGLDDPHKWAHAIHTLKEGKAHGACGWRHEELRLLPFRCISDLCALFQPIFHVGLTQGMMMARTILLPKRNIVDNFNHVRPITILGVLHRLIGKIVFKAVSKTWIRHLPPCISGGLPGRGVKDIALHQKVSIEKRLMLDEPIGGFSLDLQKAFNTFPRKPLIRLFSRLGVPAFLSVFWIQCLSLMQRFPQHRGRLGKATRSTTGIPEGDSLSVLGMLALSALFFFTVVRENIHPYTYADNWSWHTLACRPHFLAFQAMLNLVTLLRVLIDFAKSWQWATNKDWRKQFHHVHLFFPAESFVIPTLSSVKDLGEYMLYNKMPRLGFVKSKFAEAKKRIRQVKTLPCDIQTKCRLIQSSAWPVAFYAADSLYVGSQHFQDLRRAVTLAVVGKGNFPSSWLAVHNLSKYICDPLLFVFTALCRSLQRFARQCPQMFHECFHRMLQLDTLGSFGPLTTLKRYARVLGWKLTPEAELIHESGFRISLIQDSGKYIAYVLRQWWPWYIVSQNTRKGIKDVQPHFHLTRSVFQSFTACEQKLLVRNFVGGFQTEVIKSVWLQDTEDKCPFCGDVDNRAHQFLHCPHFADVRARHNNAMHVLDQERPTWVYIPVALEHDEVRILRRIMQSIQPVPPAPPLPLPQGLQLTTFFTDGGAIHPCDVGARLAAFAVVQDVRSNVTQFHQQNLTDSFPDFRVITSGLVGGSQTTARGELMAFLRALQAAVQLDSEIRVDFVTDAKYVWDLVLHILDPNNNVIEINTSNVDIIEQIIPLWQHPRFQLRKVKSHRSIETAKDSADLYDILGNAVVDKAVTAVLQFAHKDLIAMANRIAAFHHEEQTRLKSVAEFFLDLNRTRLKIIEQNKVQSSPGTIVQTRSLQAVMPSRIMGDDAASFLASYKPEGHTQFATDEIPDMECFLACQQGARLGMAVVFWLQSLLWPPDVQQKTDDASDWGISWLELFFDFHISTAMTFPIRVEGLKKQAKYIEFSSQEASLLPPQKRSPANQAFCLQKMISTIETISGLQFIPKFKSHKCSSLNHVNLQGKTTGIPRRPTLKHPDLTIHAVSEYFALCHGKLVQGHAFQCFTGQPSIDIPDVVDLPTDERCRLYQRLMKRASRSRASGG